MNDKDISFIIPQFNLLFFYLSKMASEGSVFVIGNPLLDISATVDNAYLEKYDTDSYIRFL